MATFKVSAAEMDSLVTATRCADKARSIASALKAFAEERPGIPEEFKTLLYVLDDLSDDYQVATCGPLGTLLDRWEKAKSEAEAVSK